MAAEEEWIWEMQGEMIVAGAASSRYRGRISVFGVLWIAQKGPYRKSEPEALLMPANQGGTAE